MDSPPTRFLTGARSEYFPDDDELSDHVIMEEKHEVIMRDIQYLLYLA